MHELVVTAQASVATVSPGCPEGDGPKLMVSGSDLDGSFFQVERRGGGGGRSCCNPLVKYDESRSQTPLRDNQRSYEIEVKPSLVGPNWQS